MKQGHVHTESLRSKPVEVSVSTTPETRTQGCHRRQERHRVPSSAPSPSKLAPESLNQKPHSQFCALR